MYLRIRAVLIAGYTSRTCPFSSDQKVVPLVQREEVESTNNERLPMNGAAGTILDAQR